jgi:hypothetical protein
MSDTTQLRWLAATHGDNATYALRRAEDQSLRPVAREMAENDANAQARLAWRYALAALEIEALRERLDRATGLLRDARDYGEFHDDGREIVGDIGAFLDRD